MPQKIASALFLTFLLAALVFAPGVSWANVDEQFAICTRGVALGNALTADPPGPLSIHYNPAGLSRYRGKVLTGGITIPSIEMSAKFEKPANYVDFFGYSNDPVAGSETKSQGGAINIPFSGPASLGLLAGPNMGFSWTPAGSRWSFGFALYTPSAVGYEYPTGPAIYEAQMLYQMRLVAAPGVSYRLSDTLAVGLSVGIGSASLGIRNEVRAPNDLVALTGVLGELTKDLDDVITLGLIPFPLFGGGLLPYESLARITADNLQDNFNTSYNIGVLWDPVPWFSWGLTYQSETRVKYGGTFTIEYSKRWQNMMNWLMSNELMAIFTQALGLPTQGGIEYQRGRATLDMTFPRRIQSGIMLRPIPQLKLLFDLNWTEWSCMQYNSFTFDQNIQFLQVSTIIGYQGDPDALDLTRNLKDTIGWGLGAEIMPLDWLTLRLGWEWRPSSVKEDRRDLMFPLPDINTYGCGLGFKLTRNTDLDLSFAYMDAKPMHMNQEDDTYSTLLNERNFTAIVYNPYAGLNVETDIDAMIVSMGLTYYF